MATIAVVVFGVLVLAIFLRSLGGNGKKRRAVFGIAHETPRRGPGAHGPRHTGSRARGAAGPVPVADKLVQLQRLRDKGHITDEDYRRTAGDLLGHEPTRR